MRQIIASAFVSLDGVMQAPGGQDEDRSGGFQFGGWTAPYWDDAIAETMGDLFSAPFDLLLGRRTYDIFAGYWPQITDEADPFPPISPAYSIRPPNTSPPTTARRWRGRTASGWGGTSSPGCAS
ncbi:hypothetical protein [Serratia nevei]|uniref:hypothetical protein n=1 Tax=Serratia nevei TaxID=2703794 RepID=UPI003FA72701